MKCRIHEAALHEWREAVATYEGKCAGLGRRFDEAVQKAVAFLCEHPYAAPKVREHFRRKRVLGWPYSLLYQESPDELLVVAVMHERKQPNAWAARIE